MIWTATVEMVGKARVISTRWVFLVGGGGGSDVEKRLVTTSTLEARQEPGVQTQACLRISGCWCS